MKRQHLVSLALGWMLAAGGCTAVNVAALPSDRSGQTIFLSAGDIPEPYESLGIVQVQRSGLLLLGFFDPVGTDIDTGLREVLLPEIQRLGGSGAIHVRFHQTQYVPLTRALFAFPFFFIPLPSAVTVQAEVVKLTAPRGPAPVGDPLESGDRGGAVDSPL